MLFRSDVEVIIEIEHLGRPVGRIVYIGTIFVENAVSGDVHVGFEHYSGTVCIQLCINEHTVLQTVNV